jgi:hypothetical protein
VRGCYIFLTTVVKGYGTYFSILDGSHQVLNTSAPFLLMVSTVRAEWMTEAELAVVTGLSEDLVSQGQIGPIGPRVLKQSIMGTRAVLLVQLEATIRQSLPPDSLLELECSVEAGQLAWWTTGSAHSAVRRQAGYNISYQKPYFSTFFPEMIPPRLLPCTGIFLYLFALSFGQNLFKFCEVSLFLFSFLPFFTHFLTLFYLC